MSIRGVLKIAAPPQTISTAEQFLPVRRASRYGPMRRDNLLGTARLLRLGRVTPNAVK
jgi:hypothetical protein